MDASEFKVLLNGPRDLDEKLQAFKESCEAHQKQRTRMKRKKKHQKKRYYQLGLMARIVFETTLEELRHLLKNGARTFLVDAVVYQQHELDDILGRINYSIAELQQEEPDKLLVTGLALEITNDSCRVGRLRNGCPVLVYQGSTLVLTTDLTYKYSSYKEIAYVLNLNHYIKSLQKCDLIMVGKEVRGRVVKILKDALEIVIVRGGLMNSYDYLELPNQCNYLEPDVYPQMFLQDLVYALNWKINFIVVSKVQCKAFLKELKNVIADEDLRLVGALHLENISSRMLDTMGLIRMLDYLWIPDMFSAAKPVQDFVYQDVLPIAKCLKKPVIGSVPLEQWYEFKQYENHPFIWKLDAILIEKSSWCKRYPLIVKKLLPLKDFRCGMVENCVELKKILTVYDTVVNFIIRTISTIQCQAIVLHSICINAAENMGRMEIYCPVFVVVHLEDDAGEKDLLCKYNLARAYNLRRNLNTIFYTDAMNECNYRPIDFGVDFMRKKGILDNGDMVISVEVARQTEEDADFTMGQEVVVMRAVYIQPHTGCEPYMYADPPNADEDAKEEKPVA